MADWLSLLARVYAKLGDLKRAEEYCGKIADLSPVMQTVWGPFTALFEKIDVMLTQGVILAAKNSWKEADQCFEKGIEMTKMTAPMQERFARQTYVPILEMQGRTEEAKIQLKEIDRIQSEAEEAFAHVNVEASLMAPRLATQARSSRCA